MLVIVGRTNCESLYGPFGPFSSLADPELKKALVENGFMREYEDVEMVRWYSNQNGCAVVIREVRHANSENML